MAIGSLDVALNLETAAFTAGVKAAQTSVLDLAAGVAAGLGIFKSVESALDKFSEAVVGGLESAVAEVEKFNDVAQQLGTTANSGVGLEKLSLGLQSLGLDAKSSVDVVENFGEVLAKAFIGKGDGGRFLKDIGVSVKTTTGEMRPLIDVLEQTLGKMRNYTSDAAKMAAASRLFGISESQLAVLLGLTSTQINKAAQDSTFMANAFAGLSERTAGLTQSFASFGNQSLAIIAVGLNAVIDAVNAVIGAFEPLGNRLLVLIDQFGGFDQAWPFLVTTGNEFLAMTAVIVGCVASIVSAVESIVSSFGHIVVAAVEMANGVKAAWNGMRAVIAGGPGMNEALNAQVDLANKSADAFVKNMLEAKSDVTGLLPKMVFDGQAAGTSYFNGFKEAWNKQLPGLVKPPGGGGGSLSDFLNKGGGGGGKKGLTPDEKDIRDLTRWTDSMLDAIDPTRKWMEETANLSLAFDKGLISGEQFDQILARINQQHPPDDWTKAVNDFQKGLQSFGDSAASSLADAIVSGDNLGDVFKNLTKQLVSMAIQTLLLKPLFESVFGGGVGGGTGIFGGLLSLIGGKSPEMPQITGQSFDNTAFLQSFRGAASGAGGGSSAAVRALSSASGGQSTIGSITMNITPDKTATIADSATGQRFGVEVTKLVQGLLVKESRPGGLLRRA